MRFGEIFTTSLYKFSKYPKLLTVGNFKTFLYAMFLALVMLVGVAVTMLPLFKQDGGFASILEDELPDFKTEDGILTCENTVVDSDGVYIEVDTTKTGVLDLPDGYTQSMVISKTDVHMLNNGREQSLSFSELPDFSKESVIALLKEYSVPIYFALLGLMLMYLMISLAISMLLYAAISFFADKAAIHSGLHFGAVFKLTVFSMTFSVLLNVIFSMLNMRTFGFIAPFITLFYIIKGIISCKNERNYEGIIIEEL